MLMLAFTPGFRLPPSTVRLAVSVPPVIPDAVIEQLVLTASAPTFWAPSRLRPVTSADACPPPESGCEVAVTSPAPSRPVLVSGIFRSALAVVAVSGLPPVCHVVCRVLSGSVTPPPTS
jgi:hypothetical protein